LKKSSSGLGAGVGGRAASVRAYRRHLHEAPHARLGGRLRQGARAVGLQRLEALGAAFLQHAHEVDHRGGPLDRQRHPPRVAQVDGGELDLADVAHHLELGGGARVAGGHPHAPAGPGERAHDVAAHEPRAAHHRDQTRHRPLRPSQGLRIEEGPGARKRAQPRSPSPAPSSRKAAFSARR
jgi:hypothetical protein